MRVASPRGWGYLHPPQASRLHRRVEPDAGKLKLRGLFSREQTRKARTNVRFLPQARGNLAARMGRWSASHRKIAIFGWLAFVIAAIAIGTGAGQKTIDQQNQNVGQAHRADQILKQAGFSQSGPLNEIVVIQSKTLTVDSPAFQAVVGDVVGTVAPFSTGAQPELAERRMPTATRYPAIVTRRWSSGT